MAAAATKLIAKRRPRSSYVEGRDAFICLPRKPGISSCEVQLPGPGTLSWSASQGLNGNRAAAAEQGSLDSMWSWSSLRTLDGAGGPPCAGYMAS